MSFSYVPKLFSVAGLSEDGLEGWLVNALPSEEHRVAHVVLIPESASPEDGDAEPAQILFIFEKET